MIRCMCVCVCVCVCFLSTQKKLKEKPKSVDMDLTTEALLKLESLARDEHSLRALKRLLKIFQYVFYLFFPLVCVCVCV
jgi:hypothetical protein